MSDLVQQPPQALPAAQLPVIATNSAALILDEASMRQMEALALNMSKGRVTVPQHLQGNQGDCLAVVMQAIQWGMNPYSVGQKTHVVNGTLGYEAQLVNAVITSCGALSGAPDYEWFGPWEKVLGKFDIKQKPAQGKPGDKDYKKATEYRVPGWAMADEKGCGVRVFATLRGESAPRVLELMLEQASVRNSPLWASDPKQQLAYLALKRWASLHAPGAILGVYTPDELQDQPMHDINAPIPKGAKPADVAARKRGAQTIGPSEALLKEARAAADKGREPFATFWKGLKGVERNALADELSDLERRVSDAEKNRTIDMPASQPAAAANPVDDDFVRQMDAASGHAGGGEYVPE